MKLYVVVPCYNEREVLPETAKELTRVMNALIDSGEISPESRVTFVDDGSRDETWEEIVRAIGEYPVVEGIKLSRNQGHQNALVAGMMTVRDRCDAVITIDSDLQDDVNAIASFVKEYKAGCDVVYGVRSRRDTDTGFKRNSARLYYKFMRMMGVELVYDHADYRLLSRRALDALSEFDEVNLFLRGMVPLLGFKSSTVYYERGKRFAGESKYPLWKMFSLALEGVTSFSVKPIRIIVTMGCVFALIGVIMAIYALASHFAGHTAAGWTSIMISLWVIGGVQLIALGLIGEYVGKLYSEVKRRPRYIIEKYVDKKHDAE
ncbi:MAG: glycosyltransferase family 2 protein [Clostridia bacterium]|nr:glycosyltransferase family 2 protein [Clostridia bacterium]